MAVRITTPNEELLKENSFSFTSKPVVPKEDTMIAEGQDCAKIALPGSCSQLAYSMG